jgi:hypothetical protein
MKPSAGGLGYYSLQTCATNQKKKKAEQKKVKVNGHGDIGYSR